MELQSITKVMFMLYVIMSCYIATSNTRSLLGVVLDENARDMRGMGALLVAWDRVLLSRFVFSTVRGVHFQLVPLFGYQTLVMHGEGTLLKSILRLVEPLCVVCLTMVSLEILLARAL
eukprot:4612500-Amphidinium_carterae.1